MHFRLLLGILISVGACKKSEPALEVSDELLDHIASLEKSTTACTPDPHLLGEVAMEPALVQCTTYLRENAEAIEMAIWVDGQPRLPPAHPPSAALRALDMQCKEYPEARDRLISSKRCWQNADAASPAAMFSLGNVALARATLLAEDDAKAAANEILSLMHLAMRLAQDQTLVGAMLSGTLVEKGIPHLVHLARSGALDSDARQALLSQVQAVRRGFPRAHVLGAREYAHAIWYSVSGTS